MPQMTEAELKAYKEALSKRLDPLWKARTQAPLADNASMLEKLGRKLYSTPSTVSRATDDVALLMSGNSPLSFDDASSKVLDFYESASKSPFNSQINDLGTVKSMVDGKEVATNLKPSALGTSAKLGFDAVKAHPGATLGTIANAGMNLSGLLDNNKFGGQLIGTLAGAVVPKVFHMGLSPLVAANVAMGGGALGSLFDILRAKKEQEQKYQKQYY